MDTLTDEKIIRLNESISKLLANIAIEAKDQDKFKRHWIRKLEKMKEDLSTTLAIEFGASVSDDEM